VASSSGPGAAQEGTKRAWTPLYCVLEGVPVVSTALITKGLSTRSVSHTVTDVDRPVHFTWTAVAGWFFETLSTKVV